MLDGSAGTWCAPRKRSKAPSDHGRNWHSEHAGFGRETALPCNDRRSRGVRHASWRRRHMLAGRRCTGRRRAAGRSLIGTTASAPRFGSTAARVAPPRSRTIRPARPFGFRHLGTQEPMTSPEVSALNPGIAPPPPAPWHSPKGRRRSGPSAPSCAAGLTGVPGQLVEGLVTGNAAGALQSEPGLEQVDHCRDSVPGASCRCRLCSLSNSRTIPSSVPNSLSSIVKPLLAKIATL